jgi:hypothetical protein
MMTKLGKEVFPDVEKWGEDQDEGEEQKGDRE